MAKASDLAERMRRTTLQQGKAEERVVNQVVAEAETEPEPVSQAAPPVEAPVVAPTPIRAPRAKPTAAPPQPTRGPITKPPAGAAARRKVKTTSRYTIDLDQKQRRALKLFALDLDAGASDVIRSLLSMLQESPEIRREVTNRVEAARQPEFDD